MEEQIETIKEYALILNPNITNDELLDFVANSVVDRALIYMNRKQLDDEDVTDFYDEGDAPSELPTELERVLAEVVVGAYRNVTELDSKDRAVSSISDNGQSITYGEKMSSYLNSDESDIFSNSVKLLNKYRLPTIVENYTGV